MTPREAARWVLTLELMKLKKSGKPFDNAALKRVRRQVREVTGCSIKNARTTVADIAISLAPMKPEQVKRTGKKIRKSKIKAKSKRKTKK